MKVVFHKGVRRRLNSLSGPTLDFLFNALDSFTRLLPHSQVAKWKITNGENESRASWKGAERRAIGLQVYIPQLDCCLVSQLERKATGEKKRVLDAREMSLCKKVVTLTTKLLSSVKSSKDDSIAIVYRRAFDDRVVLEHLKESNTLEFDLDPLLDFLQLLSEQSYENRSFSYGVLIDKASSVKRRKLQFPRDFGEEKRFKAFTDGYRTAYRVDRLGRIIDLTDLEKLATGLKRGKHFYPEWSKNVALSSSGTTIGFTLTRQGDILFFEGQSLRFTRRAGRWQYWNHTYLIDMLLNAAKIQKISPKLRKKVVATLYRYALDISFRRSGGLFVVLKRATDLHEIVKPGDAIGDKKSSQANKEFSGFLKKHTIMSIPRNVVLDLSAIDGALVFSNNGKLLAYGAVLEYAKRSKVRNEEGSRSKAAKGASKYGLSIKISSDGGIKCYSREEEFIEV